MERKNIKIFYSEKFLRKTSKQKRDVLDKIEERECIFRENPFDPRLKTHKLHGKEQKFLAYSITYSIRIKFVFLDDQSVLYLDVGPHDEVY